MTKPGHKLIPAILLLLVLCSCERKTLQKEAWLAYVNSEESGLVKVQNINGIEYTLKCMVPQQQCLLFNRNNKETINMDTLLSEYRDKLHFVLRIRDQKDAYTAVRSVVFNKEMYGTLMGYANSDMNRDFTVESESGNSMCGLLHLESANSVQPELRMALSFSEVSTNDEITLVFNDHIFNNGPIRFNYSKNTFANLPTLKTESI